MASHCFNQIFISLTGLVNPDLAIVVHAALEFSGASITMVQAGSTKAVDENKVWLKMLWSVFTVCLFLQPMLIVGMFKSIFDFLIFIHKPK